MHSKTIRNYRFYHVAQSSWHTHLLSCFYLSIPYKPAHFNLNDRKAPEGGIYQTVSENIYHQEQQRKTVYFHSKKAGHRRRQRCNDCLLQNIANHGRKGPFNVTFSDCGTNSAQGEEVRPSLLCLESRR